MLIIAAALSVQDPRERPMDKQEPPTRRTRSSATSAPTSSAYLKLWTSTTSRREHLSHSKLRKLCKENFLSFVRMREWHDIHQQLHELVGRRDALPDSAVIAVATPRRTRALRDTRRASSADATVRRDPPRTARRPARQHRLRDRAATSTPAPAARSSTSSPAPALFKRKPPWVMAAELVETTRLYAAPSRASSRNGSSASREHLVKRTYSEPHWQPQTGHVVAYEKVTLYGLPIVPRRTVHYGPIDPKLSRADLHPPRAGRGRLDSDRAVLPPQPRAHRRDRARSRPSGASATCSSRTRCASTSTTRRIPAGIYNGPLFEKWRQRRRARQPDAPVHDRRDLLLRAAEENTHGLSPTRCTSTALTLPLDVPLRARPPRRRRDRDDAAGGAEPAAGRAVRVARAGAAEGEGHRADQDAAEGAARAVRPRAGHADRGASQRCRSARVRCSTRSPTQLGKISGAPIDRDAFAPHDAAAYLRMNFRVVDESGKLVTTGRDLDEIRRELGVAAPQTFAAAAAGRVPSRRHHALGLRRPARERRGPPHGMTLLGYPALVDAGKTVVAAPARLARGRAATPMRARRAPAVHAPARARRSSTSPASCPAIERCA